jgi:hypothetical protein
MKIGTVRLSDLDSKQRLSPESYLYLDDHELEVEVQVTVRSKRPTGEPIGKPTYVRVKFTPQQVQEITNARGAKSVDEVRERVASFIKDNVVAALTEATRK